jgi:hypothetical protein
VPSGENYDRTEVTCDRQACVAHQHSWTWVQPGYQEFTAGTIPVRGVLADEEGALVLVEHERGFMRAFDEHLSAVSAGTRRSRTSTTPSRGPRSPAGNRGHRWSGSS